MDEQQKIALEMREHLAEARKHAEEARKLGRTFIKVDVKSGNTSSLGKIIKTQKQADFFMKMLKAL